MLKLSLALTVATLIPILGYPAGPTCGQVLINKSPQLSNLIREAAQKAEGPSASIQDKQAYLNLMTTQTLDHLGQLPADPNDLLYVKITRVGRLRPNPGGDFAVPVEILDEVTKKKFILELVSNPVGDKITLKVYFEKSKFVQDPHYYHEFKSGTAIDEKTKKETAHHIFGLAAEAAGIALKPATADRLEYFRNKNAKTDSALKQLYGLASLSKANSVNKMKIAIFFDYYSYLIASNKTPPPISWFMFALTQSQNAQHILMRSLIQIMQKTESTQLALSHESLLAQLTNDPQLQKDLDLQREIQSLVQLNEQLKLKPGYADLPTEVRKSLSDLVNIEDHIDRLFLDQTLEKQGTKMFKAILNQ